MTVPGAAQYLAPAQAFSLDFESDAHFQACSAPELPHRLTYDALPQLEQGAAIVLFVVDCDAPEHGAGGQETVESWWASERPKAKRLLEAHAGGLIYRTRGGYRIVYRLDPPHVMGSADDGAAWRVFYCRCLLQLWRTAGIVGDPACKDWTRLYRLPHATRDREAGPEHREIIGDPTAIGVWPHCPTDETLGADLLTARQLAGDSRGPWRVILKSLEALREPPQQHTETPAPQWDGGETRRARHALESQCEAISCAPKGSRHATIYGAAADIGHLVCGREIDEQVVIRSLFEAAERSGEVKDYGKADVERCISDGLAFGKKSPPRQPLKPQPTNGNAKHNGQGHDWGAHYAEQFADSEPAPEDPDQFADAEFDGRPPPGEESPTASDPLRGLKILPNIAILGRDAFLRLAAEPVDYLWADYVVSGTIVVLAGPPGEGKTTLLFLIAAARLSTGGPLSLLSRTMLPADRGQWVVIIEAEQSEKSSARKLTQSFELLGVDTAGLDRLILVARKAVTIGSQAWAEVTTLVQAGLVSDIVLDTLARVAPANADSEQEQVAIFDSVAATIESAPEDRKPTVWAAMHTRKTRSGGLADVSGSAQRTGQADTVLMASAEKIGGQVVSVTVTAEKLREPPDEHPQPTVFAIGRDEEGRKVLRQDAVPVTDDDLPLKERVLEQLRLHPMTKTALATALKRSRKDVDDAISNLLAVKAIWTTKVKSARGRTYTGFCVTPTTLENTCSSKEFSAGPQPDSEVLA